MKKGKIPRVQAGKHEVLGRRSLKALRPNETKYVLMMDCGVRVEMILNEKTCEFICGWSPAPPFSAELFARIRSEYEPWRDKIFSDWGERNGKSVLAVTC